MVCPELADRVAVLVFGAAAGQTAPKMAAVCGCDCAAAVQLHCAGAAQQAAAGVPGLPLLRRAG